MRVIDIHGNPISRFPHQLPNGLRLLRFVNPNTVWPTGKLVLNNPSAHENLVARPETLGLEIRR